MCSLEADEWSLNPFINIHINKDELFLQPAAVSLLSAGLQMTETLL